MSDRYDWTERVGQMTASNIHEQLRTVVRDTEEVLAKFTASSSEQGGLLLDAQREMEATFERRIAEVSAEMARSLEAMRKEIDERFVAIQRQLERTVGMEERAAARMVEILAGAFAGLRRPPLQAVES